MPDDVKIAFERKVHILRLNSILPLRQVTSAVRETTKFKRIAASVGQLGLVEPLIVSRTTSGQYHLLDGHVRFAILRDQGSNEARCVIADDDDTFTYNRRVNRLATIQEHYMIVRAVERGVPEERIANVLNVDVKAIRMRRYLLSGISAEVAEILKDKPVGIQAFQKLRKMKPLRQLEVAEMMISANNYGANYAKALLATTKPQDLLKPDDLKKAVGLTSEQMGRLEREMSSLTADYKELEASYGDDMLLLVIAGGYLERMLSKPEIERFLASRYEEFLEQFRAVIASASLDQPSIAA